MNQNVSPLTAFLVLALLGAFLTAIFYLNHQALAVDRISLMATHPDGDAVVMMGNQLYKIDPDTTREKVIPLGALGISATVGGFAFFSNGDVLIVPDEYRPSIWESLAIWGRSENNHYSQTEKNQLLRCDLAATKCRVFSADLPDFTRSFRVAIDPATDKVYIADTSRHRLIKLDATGKQLALKSGFRFPNQLRLFGGELWMTDTNHHQVKQLEPASETFGQELASHYFDLGFGRKWPSDIALVDGDWWVLVMNQDMKDGRIVRYDGAWQEIRTLPLPGRADPMAMLAVNGGVLVSDYQNFALYRFDHNGERLRNLVFPQLQSALDEAQRTFRSNKLATLGTWILLFVVILAGLKYAVNTIPVGYEPLSINQGQPLNDLPEAGIWLKTHLLVRIGFYASAILLVLGLVLVVVLLIFSADSSSPMFPILMGVSFLTLVPLLVPLNKLSRSKLGLFPDGVVFINSDGFQFKQLYSELDWSEGSVKIGPYVIPLPYKMRRGLFPAKPIKTFLVPRLNGEKHINKWLMLKYQWQSPEKTIHAIVMLFVLLGGIFVVLEIRNIFF